MQRMCPFRWFVTVICGYIFYIRQGVAESIKLNSVSPSPLEVKEDDIADLVLNTSQYFDPIWTNSQLMFDTDDPKIAQIAGENRTMLVENVTIRVKGVFLGETFVKVYVNNSALLPENETCVAKGENSLDSKWCKLKEKFGIVVSRKERAIDTVFNVVIITLVVVANVAMGCKLEIPVVKETLRRPIAPITGLASQFILMPVISFLFAYFIKFSPAVALGFFALGCSPGGSASNIYTYLIGGDVSLSITMTFISTVASLGLIPLWLFTVGTHVIAKGTTLTIPFTNIVTSLLGLVIPVGIGLLIKTKRPSWAEKIVKIIRPITCIFLLFIFTVGVYANLYIFSLLSPLVLVVGCLLPYCGFIFGGLVAFIARQPLKNVITIAIETGIQNTGIAIVLLRFSLPAPAKDTSIVAPIAAAIFTPIPLVIAIIYLEIRKRCFKKYEPGLKRKASDGHEPVTPTSNLYVVAPQHEENDNTIKNHDEKEIIKISGEKDAVKNNV